MSRKQLILNAFEKARLEGVQNGSKEPSLTDNAKVLVEYIDNETGISLSDRTLRDYFNKAKAENTEDLNIANQQILDALLKYLDFDNYQDFLSFLNTTEKESCSKVNDLRLRHKKVFDGKKWLSKNKISFILIGFAVVSLIVVGLIDFKEENRWMIWKADHYEEVGFSADLFNTGRLKLYKPERIEDFRKVNADCRTTFFNPDGSEKFWYGKNISGELEIFSSLGKHPETGKTLKPLTQYMIDKYICSKSISKSE